MPDECSQDNGSDSDPSRRSTLDEQANENEQLPPGAHRFTQTNFGRSKCLQSIVIRVKELLMIL